MKLLCVFLSALAMMPGLAAEQATPEDARYFQQTAAKAVLETRPSPPEIQTASAISLFEQHCFRCHDATQAEGDLDLDDLLAKKADVSAAATLEDIIVRIREGDMPPKKAKRRPDEAQKRDMIAWVQSQIDVLAAATLDDPGNVVMPRLSRNEYRHAIRDLSGGIVLKAGEYLPNEGGAGEGFANVGEAQSMSAVQFEKYIEAAKGALQCLRVSPHDGLVWSVVPRETVDDPKAAIREATDDIIAWYIGQQQKWGALHRTELDRQSGSAHAIYLEAAWRAAHGRAALPLRLAPVALEKWTLILNDAETKSPFAEWARAWRAIPANVSDATLRATCLAIVSAKADAAALPANSGDFAPSYEISFREARDEVLWSAKMEGRWPFRIDIGDAKELFLIMTDAGDGGAGEYGLWQKGRFVFRDGTARPWQEVVKIVGANSGRDFQWGSDGEGQARLEADAVGQKPPGALKFAVPQDAIVFEVDFMLDTKRTKVASVQALVLKEKPASQSFVPGRYVFGGRDVNTKGSPKPDPNKERTQLLRKRNVSEANETKLGLNAESNLFADWTRTSIEAIGGPWPGQTPDKAVPKAPYYYTVAEVRRNATSEDLSHLRVLEERLVALAQPPPAAALEAKACGIIDTFATKAWRRELNGDDQSKLMRLYSEAAAQGVSFDSAMKVPLLVVLLSRDFLYRGREMDTFVPCAQDLVAGSKTVPLSSHALASRLSFFLWASIPDDELLRLASADKLRESAVILAQAKRMLKDPRAAALATDFAAQLWDFGDFESFTGPDEKRFPEFTPGLRQGMFDEVTTFLADLICNDRPLTALLDADYTFANSELAKHYGAATSPAGFERIALPPGRGGLPTMALFLTKTSVPLRTSPVQRGVWIVENFLGRKVPPPPMNVGQISEDEKSTEGLSIRDQLAKHRADANCAGCHARFDAMGVSLENFDPIGRWRTADRSGEAIVSTDTLHDGTELNGITGLKKYLREHQDEVFRHFTRKLLGYALGRAVLPGDRALLDRMNASLAQNGYQFSSLVEAIVTSPQFTRRRTP